MIRSMTIALTFATALAGLAPGAEARNRCPSGFVAERGVCLPLPGRHAPTVGFVPQSGFQRDDARRDWSERVDRRRDRVERRDAPRRYQTYDDGRLRNPERYGLPPLPRGQHYAIINGEVVRLRDSYGSTGNRNDPGNSDAIQGLLNSLLR